ncbi:MAG: hypothetical protein JXA89_15265, partial [Anaerolineae bacterium]|nr:hypothetical protein [Anaerolineae bacterium]
DGRLSIAVEAARYIAWSDLGGSYSDLEMRAIAYPQPSKVDYNYGLVFHERDENAFYLARVTLLGQYALHKFVNGTRTAIVPWGRSAAITTKKNDLKLVCTGSRIVFYVNDTLLFDVEDSSLAGGSLGFYVGTGNTAGVEVQFDELELVQPQASALPESTPTPQYTWADYLYFDLVASQANVGKIQGWYTALAQGQSVSCQDVRSYAVHRPSYMVPASLGSLRGIYDRYVETVNLVDRIDGQVAPLNRLQSICGQGTTSITQLSQQDMTHDRQKLTQAETSFANLILEVQQYL